MTCKNQIPKDQLPKLISKLEHFVFEAMKTEGIDPLKFATAPKNYISKLINAVYSIDQTTKEGKGLIPDKIKEYQDEAQSYLEQGDEDTAEFYTLFATNLSNMLTVWDELLVNFTRLSKPFKSKTKYKINEEGMVDMSQFEEDTSPTYTMLDFDIQANEVDPVDDIDKGIELYIRSLKKVSRINDNSEDYDEYGYTVNVDYPTFVRGLAADLENTTSNEEIVDKLTAKLSETPEYSELIKKLAYSGPNKANMRFRVAFRHSFAKALVTLFQTNIDKGTVKVFELTIAKRTMVEKKAVSNFQQSGLEIQDKSLGSLQLAHQDENDTWVLSGEDVPKIESFFKRISMSEIKTAQLDFIKGLGFELSKGTQEELMNNGFLGARPRTGNVPLFWNMYDHLIRTLSTNKTSYNNPIDVIKKDNRSVGYKKMIESDFGQTKLINDLIDTEVKYNREYNVERSVLDGDKRLYAHQLHTGFTVLNKYYSDADRYPTLESIYTEPSMAWLNPETNPSIRNSIIFNSLFFTDKNDTTTYGKRRRVTRKDGVLSFSSTEGTPTSVIIVNNKGLGIVDNEGEKFNSSTTSLSKVDKILQDVNTFINKGFKSVLRLGDKSTDLGISMDYYVDPITKKPINRPIDTQVYSNSFANPSFLKYIQGVLIDQVSMRYLNKKGFLKEFKMSDKNLKNTWGFFDDNNILNKETKDRLDQAISVEDFNIDEIPYLIEALSLELNPQFINYFNNYYNDFIKLLDPVKSIVGADKLVGKNNNINDFVKYYLANAVVLDIENMKMFFGDPVFFKDPHKRFSAVSASGKFTSVDDSIIEELNYHGDNQSYGFFNNLNGRMLAERLGMSDDENIAKLKNEILNRQSIDYSFKSAVIKEVEFSSKQSKTVIDNIELLKKGGYLSEQQLSLYNNSLKQVIIDKYEELNKEADGQGKCTFDFYRTISILTNEWDKNGKQEDAYKKIVMYNHYNQLLKNPKLTEEERGVLLEKRNNVGYESIKDTYFPPKKFQYSGHQKYEKIIDGKSYTTYIPVFDKFSLQPLIPTVIAGTSDEELAMRMEFEGIGYVKLESGTKIEVPKNTDSLYEDFNVNDTDKKEIIPFKDRILSNTTKFNSEQELYFDFLKEQVKIDAEIHENVTFGTQMRKLTLMNMLSQQPGFVNRPEFIKMYTDYKNYISDLVRIEKYNLYRDLGIVESNGKLDILNMSKMIEYFLKEVDKKDQDSNVRKALRFDEVSGEFEIPLDAATQAQIIEGIIVSAFNNKVVRYKTNGSMLTQVATTGNEATVYSSDRSEQARLLFGQANLKYYDVVDSEAGAVVTQMEVKIGLTGKWKRLLKLTASDGNPISTRERLNEALVDSTWVENNKDNISLIAYRIPTQGRNFLDSMIIKEFLPEEFGDAIIMPSEVVIKSGSDFDIDKMFVFYPNLNPNTGEAYKGTVNEQGIFEGTEEVKAITQNKLYRTMKDIILHPSNYMELVTPSTNFHIEPIIDEIYIKLGITKPGEARKKTDYKNTELFNEILNMAKFESLLKGKKDLGIAAIANTFNVLFQLSGARSHREFLESNKLISFFNNPNIVKTSNLIDQNALFDKNNGLVKNVLDHLGLQEINYGDIYDEKGMIKSEFFSEFINAFVDVAKDDYVFAINAVTELTPIMFYMKYMGLSSKKILYFINQPVIRNYIANLNKYESLFVRAKLDEKGAEYERLKQFILNKKNNNKLTDEEVYLLLKEEEVLRGVTELDELSIRKNAMADTLRELGLAVDEAVMLQKGNVTEVLLKGLNHDIDKLLDLQDAFEEDSLFNNIQNRDTKLSTLSYESRLTQLAYLVELTNLKVQTDSMTEGQRLLNFDTNPYTSSFDIYQRNNEYIKAVNNGKNILSPGSIVDITTNSVISPLNVSKDLESILNTLMPIRNNPIFNSLILKALNPDIDSFNDEEEGSSKTLIRTQDEQLRFARTAKNDFNQYLLQNFLDSSKEGSEFFKNYFNTSVGINDYLLELITTNKITKQLKYVKSLEYYEDIVEKYPILSSLIVESGENNPLLKTYRFLSQGTNIADKESQIRQYSDIVNSTVEDMEPVKTLFRDLGLYSIFQSGMNISDVSYSFLIPIEITNKLVGYSVDEFNKNDDKGKTKHFSTFLNSLFRANNPVLYGLENKLGLTNESSKKGKWYFKDNKPRFRNRKNVVVNTDTTDVITMPVSGESMDLITEGVKKVHSLSHKIPNSLVKFVSSNVEKTMEASLYKVININSMTQEEKESFAKLEGFEDWDLLEQVVMEGHGDNISQTFILGNTDLYVYRINDPLVKSISEDINKESPISTWSQKNNVSLTKTEEEIMKDFDKEKLTPSETIEEYLTRKHCS